MECVFCGIVKKEIPARIVYEDEKVMAFLDINPVSKGHTLVIPKEHHEDIMEMPDEILGSVVSVVKKVSAALKKALGADGINILQSNGSVAGQVIKHVHFHVIPRFEGDGISFELKNGKLDEQVMDDIEKKIKSMLGENEERKKESESEAIRSEREDFLIKRDLEIT